MRKNSVKRLTLTRLLYLSFGALASLSAQGITIIKNPYAPDCLDMRQTSA
jgi:hypothetical protein